MANCQLEYVQSGRADTVPCDKPAMCVCADCGTTICSDYGMECCGDSFCGQCYDHHVAHSCVKKPVPRERGPLPSAFRPTSEKAN
jgi:hypothetical protein